MPDGTELSAGIEHSKFTAKVKGTKASIAEVGEQLAWLGAALRSSPYESGVGLCVPRVRYTGSDHDSNMGDKVPIFPVQHFKLEYDFQQNIKDSEASNGQCWSDMFRNPVLVQGFPIRRKRDKNIGLEIPLHMMAGLLQTNRIEVYDDKPYIKGFSAMLVPTRVIDDTIVWHLFFNGDGSRISYVGDTVQHVEGLTVTHIESLRHVVGWCSDTRNFIGKLF